MSDFVHDPPVTPVLYLMCLNRKQEVEEQA